MQRLDLIYVTPERLRNQEFLELLKRHGCSLFVVDEAHCVSQWGHDFRPAYAQLRQAAAALGRPPILALTATATRAVEREVLEVLGIPTACCVRTSMERKNLHYGICRAASDSEKLSVLGDLLAQESGSGLVYCSTIKAAKLVHEQLVVRNHAAGLYHGDLPAAVRDVTQDAFMDGRYRMVVATKAFGMGIDKPNTRFVIHYQLPDSIETYVQESGRAGRDGAPARATLIHDPRDARVQRFFLRHKQPPKSAVNALLAWLAPQRPGAPLDFALLDGKVADRWRAVLLADLMRLGVLARDGDNQHFKLVEPFAKTATERLARMHSERRACDRQRLDSIIAYTESADCRTNRLLRHFEEEPAALCARCDACTERKTRVVRRPGRPRAQSPLR